MRIVGRCKKFNGGAYVTVAKQIGFGGLIYEGAVAIPPRAGVFKRRFGLKLARKLARKGLISRSKPLRWALGANESIQKNQLLKRPEPWMPTLRIGPLDDELLPVLALHRHQ